MQETVKWCQNKYTTGNYVLKLYFFVLANCNITEAVFSLKA